MKNNLTRRAFVGSSAGLVAAGLSAPKLLSAAAPKPACTLENEYLKYVVGTNGCNLQFVDKQDGKDYCGGNKSHPALSLMKGGKRLVASDVTYADGLLTARFGDSGVTVVVRPTVREHYIVFEVVSVSPDDVEELTFADIPLTLEATPEEPFAACAMALNLQPKVSELPGLNRRLRATCYRRFGFAGAKVALLGCPQSKFRQTMQEAVGAAKDLPHSPIGGPWALGQPITQGSYLFAGGVSEKSVDAWIKLAQELGMNQINICGPCRHGDYLPNPGLYPNGHDSLKAVVDKLHAAGLKVGLHTFAFFINKACPWVTPVPDPRLAEDATFTLSKALTPESDTVFVNESTEGLSAIVGTFVRNSVTLRIDDELITYSGISKEPPYALTGCKRGVCGTRVSAHPRGAKVHHLKECFGHFAPDGESTLFGEVAGKLAETYNKCGFDMMYLDALDGSDLIGGGGNSWHYGSKFTFELWKRLKKPALMEMSTFHHHLWYVRSRIGALDHPARSHKHFIDIHCRGNENGRRIFLPGHLGWWALKAWSAPQGERTFADDIEYLMCKGLGTDVGFSLQGIGPGSVSNTPAFGRLAPIIKRYEDLRYSKKVPEAIKAKLRVPGDEFTLIGSLEKGWRFQPIQYARHKVTGSESPDSTWQTTNKFESQPVRLRIEALMSAGPYDAPGNITLADFTSPDDFPARACAAGVTARLEPSQAQLKAGTASGCYTASNSKPTRSGTWTKAEKTFTPPLNLSKHQALGVWIHGDGQQEVLNFQMRHPKNIYQALSEHYVDIDFTGWRYFELIEPEGKRYSDYQWGYSGFYSIYRAFLRFDKVETLGLWYNNLPPGKKVTCYISPIKAMPLVKTKLVNPAITIGGQTITFPVEIESGCYLEFNNPTDCKLYGPKGEALGEVTPQGPVPVLAAGDNKVKFKSGTPAGISARANVTVIGQGKPRPTG